jgi:hypothetical protein
MVFYFIGSATDYSQMLYISSGHFITEAVNALCHFIVLSVVARPGLTKHFSIAAEGG